MQKHVLKLGCTVIYFNYKHVQAIVCMRLCVLLCVCSRVRACARVRARACVCVWLSLIALKLGAWQAGFRAWYNHMQRERALEVQRISMEAVDYVHNHMAKVQRNPFTPAQKVKLAAADPIHETHKLYDTLALSQHFLTDVLLDLFKAESRFITQNWIQIGGM